MSFTNLPYDITCEILNYLDIYDLYKLKLLSKEYYSVINYQIRKSLVNNYIETCDKDKYKDTIHKLTTIEYSILLCMINAINNMVAPFSINLINTFIDKQKFRCLRFTRFGTNTMSILLYCDIRVNYIEYILSNTKYQNTKILIYNRFCNIELEYRNKKGGYTNVVKDKYNTIEEELNDKFTFTMITYSFRN